MCIKMRLKFWLSVGKRISNNKGLYRKSQDFFKKWKWKISQINTKFIWTDTFTKQKASNTSQWEKSFLILLHKCLNVASLFQGIIHLQMRKIYIYKRAIFIINMINIALLALKSLVSNIFMANFTIFVNLWTLLVNTE